MAADISGQAEQGATSSVLQRKARSGRVEHQSRAMSVAKALRITLAKVADDLFDLALAAIGLRMETRAGEDLAELLTDPALLMSLDGPAGRRAAAVLDPLLVGGLIQQQTMGKVMPDSGDAGRVMTETDAAISAPFLDALLERAAVLPETEAERQLLQGFRFGTRAEDARLLLMTLEQPVYQVVHITVDISAGTRQGTIILILPLVDEEAGGTGPDHDGVAAAGDNTDQHSGTLNDTVMALHVDLNVAVARLRMPLGDMGALEVGNVLQLGAAAFDQSRILTQSGLGVGGGTLGQVDGVRTLRLASPKAGKPAPEQGAGTTGMKNHPPDVDHGAVKALDRDGAAVPPGLPDPSEPPDLGQMPDTTDLAGLSGQKDFPELLQSDVG